MQDSSYVQCLFRYKSGRPQYTFYQAPQVPAKISLPPKKSAKKKVQVANFKPQKGLHTSPSLNIPEYLPGLVIRYSTEGQNESALSTLSRMCNQVLIIIFSIQLFAGGKSVASVRFVL